MKSLKSIFARAALPAAMLLGLSHGAMAQSPDRAPPVHTPSAEIQRLRRNLPLHQPAPPDGQAARRVSHPSAEALRLRQNLREIMKSHSGQAATPENDKRLRDEIAAASKEYTDSKHLKAADMSMTIPVYGCMEITSGGTYQLQNDIVADRDLCINIHDTADLVLIDGQGHTISVNPANPETTLLLYAHNAAEPFIDNVNFRDDVSSTYGSVVFYDTSEPVLDTTQLHNVFVSVESSPDAYIYFNAADAGGWISIVNSDSAAVTDNVIYAAEPYSFHAFDSNNGVYAGNMALGNPSGSSDDGFLFESSPGRTMSGNLAQYNYAGGFFDCGFEIVGHHTNMTLDSNYAYNEPRFFGGWYGASLDHSSVTNNIATYNVGSLFTFGYFGNFFGNPDAFEYPDPSIGPGIALFNNNTFSGNSGGSQGSSINYATTNPVLPGGSVYPSSKPIISAPGDIANNTFLNNSFNEVVVLTPAAGFSGYGNSCIRGTGSFNFGSNPIPPPVLMCSY